MRQALLARGIRVPEDDPLFVLLEVNEIHFEAIAAKHFQAVNRHMVVEVVSRVLAQQGDRPKNRCIDNATLERAAGRLDAVALTFARYEQQMSHIARAEAKETARVIAGQVLAQISRDVNATLGRFEKFGSHVAVIAGNSAEMINAARIIHSTGARKAKWWMGLIVAATALTIGGALVGRSITASAFEKVQAACLATQIR